MSTDQAKEHVMRVLPRSVSHFIQLFRHRFDGAIALREVTGLRHNNMGYLTLCLRFEFLSSYRMMPASIGYLKISYEPVTTKMLCDWLSDYGFECIKRSNADGHVQAWFIETAQPLKEDRKL